ncbi:iron chelate uptake ABC transporter family permease subunit [Pseudahrensia aquimaris]|uniref:High-affinity zinc uptake system membrane protein ZnuB n=1 Tax=Pseudahrensia aquimaris TaxID=744461 RepID=A0ABW3FJF6_9HYPH
MLDDFFVRALLGGIMVALVAGPLGCFVVWRRLAYFGDTLAHAALLGVALAILFQVSTMGAVFGVCAAVALLLAALQNRLSISSDVLLGILAHGALATSFLALSLMSGPQVDLQALLFGDILSISKTNLATIAVGGAIVLAVLARFWEDLFAATVNQELARAEGAQPDRANIIFMFLMAAVIALSMKIIGALLITALLIIPAATARQVARTPEQMAVYASLIGALAVLSGLFASARYDTPSGASIILAALGLFVLSIAIFGRKTSQR